MKTIFKTNVVKTFAEFTFNKIISVCGWKVLEKYFSAGSNANEFSIKIPESQVKLTNLFYISKKNADLNELSKSGNLRYNTYTIFEDDEKYCYLSTQWGYSSDKLNLDLINLQKFVNSQFFPLFNIVLDEINKILTFEENKNKIAVYTRRNGQNKVFFGCPGTGKSRLVDLLTEGVNTKKVTFHPEYDYGNFVGVYKPFTDSEKRILYQFIPQVFTKIYVEAWKNLDKPYYLVIDEINRGNCASIFGDLFQLLDRDKQGFSQYFVHVDTDLAYYLEQAFENTEYANQIKQLYFEKNKIFPTNPYTLLYLPNNLSILATMNTSDQSLFPMDSAFKRRWDWQYVPVDYTDAEKQVIEVGEKKYSWATFLRKINARIYGITESEDKQMGNRFVNTEGIITTEILVNKILFYLWFDVYKHESAKNKHYIFKTSQDVFLKYADFFQENTGFNLKNIEDFLAFNQIEALA